jgi:hypothetical protein
MTMSRPRIIGAAADAPGGVPRCTCCDRPLKGKVAWLELDQRTDTFHDRGDVPAEQSQGWFPFGVACAASIMRDVAA